MKQPIRIWAFKDAPIEFRELCEQDDADYLAEVPSRYLGDKLPVLPSNTIKTKALPQNK
jgi:hypothetical protein